MNRMTKIALAAAALALASQAGAQVTFYESEGFQGRSITTNAAVDNLSKRGLRDPAGSVVVEGQRGDRWEVCEDRRFRGRCIVLRPGRYPSLEAIGMDDGVSSVRAVDRNARVADERYARTSQQLQEQQQQQAPAMVSRVVLYENEGFQGRNFTADESVADFRRSGFNDRASSAVVTGERWEVCSDAGFGGSCTVLRPGQYPSLGAMGLNDRISSVRGVGIGARVDDRRYAPQPLVTQDYGRRNGERLYLANVVAVRAVVEDSGQRCWVEREQVNAERGGANVPGALIGAVLGGILGHQVGGGTGKDVATGVGVVAGAAIGGNAGRTPQGPTTQDVQRCRQVPGEARPAYWDVTYNFRGQDYRVQMTTQPGSTVTVNEQGEPRA